MQTCAFLSKATVAFTLLDLACSSRSSRHGTTDVSNHSWYTPFTNHRAKEHPLPCSLSGGLANATLREVSSATMEKLRDLLVIKKPKQLNVGGDTTKYPSYKDINLLGAWMVQNEYIQETYDTAKDQIDTSSVVNATIPATNQVGSIEGARPLRSELNEKYFFHGTKPEFVNSIACNGLREGGGLFGKGVYLADVPEKFDQYTTHSGEGDKKLLADIARSDSEYVAATGDVFYGFVVRAMLGRTFEGKCDCSSCEGTKIRCGRCGQVANLDTGEYVKSWWRHNIVQPDAVPDAQRKHVYAVEDSEDQFNSLCVQHEKGTCIQRFNECIVPQGSDRAQVEFLIAYERCKDRLADGPCEPTQQDPSLQPRSKKEKKESGRSRGKKRVVKRSGRGSRDSS